MNFNKLLTVFCLSMLSCCPGSEFKSADLVFVIENANAGPMGDAIIEATGSKDLSITHVGIVEVAGDSVFVIDASPKNGVSRRPLSQFCAELGSSSCQFLRLKEDPDAEAVINRAKALIGKDYDFSFLPANGSFYCSEFVQVCFLDETGNPLFESSPMNFKSEDGSFPQYWVDLFARQGIPIPQDVPGTNPHDMFLSPLLEPATSN